MENKKQQIPFFTLYSDEYLKTLVLEYLELKNVGQLPADSRIAKHCKEIAEAYGISYSLSLTIEILTNEVFERFAIK